MSIQKSNTINALPDDLDKSLDENLRRWVHSTDLKLGDIIREWKNNMNAHCSGDNKSFERICALETPAGTYKEMFSHIITVHIDMGTKRYYCPINSMASVYRPGGWEEPAKVTPLFKSRWNGTCSKCGLGTYTGLFNIEHENGSCKSG